jgi:two-component system OmpR family sensor kinase
MNTFQAFAWRITRGYVALACALVLLVVLVSTLLAFLLYAGTLNEAVTQTARRAADMAAQARMQHLTTAQTASKIVSRLEHGRVQIVAFDDAHHLLAGRLPPPSFGRELLEPFGSLFGAHPQIVRFAGGVLVIAPNLSRFVSVLGWYWSIMIPVGLAAALVAWFAGRNLTRRALDPLESVTSALRRVAAGDFQPEPLANGGRELSALTSAYNDVAHRLTASTAQRREDDARMRQFIADAGHELRTPLTVIMGYLDMLRLGAITDGPTVSRIHETMRDESHRMRAVIEKLILLARLDRAPTQPAKTVDVSAIVRSVAAQLAPLADDRIAVDAPRAAPVQADESELYEALKNIIDNAVKYAPNSPIEISVDPGEDVVISVSDRGPGIEAADLPHVFERFYRGNHRHDAEGSGLGLAIARRAIERAGGSIALESSPGTGTRVTVRLPPLR